MGWRAAAAQKRRKLGVKTPFCHLFCLFSAFRKPPEQLVRCLNTGLSCPIHAIALDNAPGGSYYFFPKSRLQILKMLLKETEPEIISGSYILSQVPLGRFYSSRPSLRSQREIVPE